MARRPWTEVIPGYAWDTRMQGGRYRIILPDGRLGPMISAADMADNLRTIHNNSAERFSRLAEDAVLGRILPADFQEAMRIELRHLYNATSALAVGGYANMTAEIWGRNGGILRGEYRYLAQFAQDIADGKLTPAQAAARAALYVGKAYSRFWDEDGRIRSLVYEEERWVAVGDEKTCVASGELLGCAERDAMGWVPTGTHDTSPGAGKTPCLGNCRCHKEYRKRKPVVV